MEPIGQYIFTVCCAAMVSAVVRQLTRDSRQIKLITGLFMVLAILSPLADLRMNDLSHILPDVSDEVKESVEKGQESYSKELARCISERVEAYILDKGGQLGVSLDVQVELSEDPMPVPVRVRLKGNVSPYTKSRLQQILAKELGIGKEDQIWT
jgi:hypothetical protein